MSAGEETNLARLTRREFADRMASGGLRACIVPVGATEQHHAHLAFGNDWRSVFCIAQRTAERLRPHVLVAPAVMAGVSEHHMKHPGTLTLRPATFLAVLDDVVHSMVRAGFTNVLVLNGHGGNNAPVAGVWDQLLRLHRVNLQYLSYWDVLDAGDAAELLRGGSRMPEDLPGHAAEFETALALAAFPEDVRRGRATGTAALADADQGREFLRRIVERLTAYLQEMIDGTRVAEVPPFYP